VKRINYDVEAGRVLELLERRGRMSAADVAAELGVSPMTARVLLGYMTGLGRIRKIQTIPTAAGGQAHLWEAS
jgi:predicted ArsR family transcriptional regulator